MKGDFTRFTFDPTKHYTRVLKQQGRVDLDADWNESGEIADYLDRQTRIDVIGKAGVAAHPKFTITSAPPNLTLSPARFYVDGIFVEYPGEVINLPAAPDTVDLLYLDVWDRHITAIEDPGIREVALGGPDICTRVKTEVQVRVDHGLAVGLTCVTATLPVASTGTLSAVVEPTPPSDDPCLIAPSGGYRGRENRLYRVEIHAPGALGIATFKWSRDNGSVAFAVTEFPAVFPNRVRVSRLGHDQVLGFRPGDWVEILGDQNELVRDNPGQLLQVTNVNEADRELVLSAAVVPVLMNQHPRVRRWDQTTNAITTGAGPFDLEDGIQVSFAGTATSTDFHTGDYWVFAARAATGAIETPAPQPMGIVHHYAKLAVVTWPPAGPPTIDMCIPEFPPLTEVESGCCCCTVKVAPKGGDFTSIQDAVNSHPGKPLIVCIEPGVYTLTKPVVVNRDNITIRGCGHLSRVLTADAANIAFEVRNRTNIKIESLGIQAGAWAIISQAHEFSVMDCLLQGGGIWIGRHSQAVQILRNDIITPSGPGIALGGIPPEGKEGGFKDETGRIRISENRIVKAAEAGIASVVAENPKEILLIDDVEISNNWISRCANSPKLTGFIFPNVPVTGGIALTAVRTLLIRDNLIENCGSEAIPASGVGAVFCVGVRIEGNLIRRNGTSDPGFNVKPVSFQAGIFSYMIGSVFDPDSEALFILGNSVSTPAGQSIFALTMGETAVHDNHLESAEGRTQPGGSMQIGTSLVVAAFSSDGDSARPAALVFNGNQVTSRIDRFPQNETGSRCWFFSSADVGLDGNRFQQPDRDGRVVMANVLIAGFLSDLHIPTARITGNRFFEWKDQHSLLASAQSVIAVGNHHAHSLDIPAGPSHVSVANILFLT